MTIQFLELIDLQTVNLYIYREGHYYKVIKLLSNRAKDFAGVLFVSTRTVDQKLVLQSLLVNSVFSVCMGLSTTSSQGILLYTCLLD